MHYLSCYKLIHATSVVDWLDERGLAISVPKSTITLFIFEFNQSLTHHHVTLNSCYLSLERNLHILGVSSSPI